jgi:asparagine synthase (glutamine-hydrolysing)
VLSGSGGDEVLAGYEGAFWPQASVELRRQGFVWQSEWYDLVSSYRRWGWKGLFYGDGRRLKDLIRPLARKTGLLELLRPNSNQDITAAEKYRRGYSRLSFHEQTLFHFTVGLLPYYLRSNDHFTMAIPLEHRFPFLDYRIVELGLQMPVSYLFKDGWTKYILRKAMEPYLPEQIVWRKIKMGFPFAYRRFLSQHRAQFEPMVSRLGNVWVRNNEGRDYDEVLDTRPEKLWRLCSTAFWLEKRGLSKVIR